MAQFTVNTTRLDPYKNFKFRVKWDGQTVAGVSKITGGLKRKTEIVKHREGGDPSTDHLSPGRSNYEPITLERGVTFDRAFEAWANLVFSVEGDAAVSLKNFRKDISIELYNLQGVKVAAYNLFRCWVSEFNALPDLDANANAVAIESLVIQYEGYARDEAVVETAEL